MLLYVIATKSTKTGSGVKKFAKEVNRISAVDIHLMRVKHETRGEGKDAKDIYFIDVDENTQILGRAATKTQTKFTLTEEALAKTYSSTLDFSFMYEREFEDFSSQIMSKIQKNVDDAFNSMTSLRNNITNWVLGDNVVAASQVGIQKDRLDSSIAALDTDLGYTRLEEKKSKKDLDKLIKEVILKRLLK